MSARKTDFPQLKTALSYWLLARSQLNKAYETPLTALEFAAKHHTGSRKNGQPEFSHQIEIAHFARALEPHLINAALCLTAALLHDVREDYGVSDHEIASRFGLAEARVVELLTKVYGGVSKSEQAYYAALALDACASIIKGCDRLHNHSTMAGAFSPAKQLSYLQETEDLVLPMLAAAKLNFPSQEPAYEIIEQALRSQIAMLRPALEALIEAQAALAGAKAAG